MIRLGDTDFWIDHTLPLRALYFGIRVKKSDFFSKRYFQLQEEVAFLEAYLKTRKTRK